MTTDHWQPPSPENLAYVIGDIHGCGDHLERLLAKIDNDVAATGSPHAELVFIGDYVDRGDESATILRFLATLTDDFGPDVTCIAGNHEQMMSAFINNPLGKAKRWLRYGGIQTLASFGIAPPSSMETPSAAELLDLAADLRDAMGPDLVRWLDGLPTAWHSGNLWAVHAGADPERPMDQQDPQTLLWGHPDFFEQERGDGQWVAVGHQPVKEPFAQKGRIAIDTGAVYGGSLTALRASPDEELAFLSS